MQTNIKAYRESEGLSMAGLAEKINAAEDSNVDASTISKLEKGDMQVTLAWLSRIASALNCDPRDLIGGDTGSVPTVTSDLEPLDLSKGHHLASLATGTKTLMMVKTDVMSELEIGAGDVLLIDVSVSDVDQLSIGDIAAIELTGSEDKQARTLLRMFVPPRLFTTNSKRSNAIPITISSNEMAKIAGKVLNQVRKV